MKPYHFDSFLCNVHSDESIPDHLDEIEEVYCLMVEESEGWVGYQDWSSSLDLVETLGEVVNTCGLCSKPIHRSQALNHHHPVPRSESGQTTIPVHQVCHIEHHRSNGDFSRWGRKGGQVSAINRHWAFVLKNVKNDPAYDFDRMYHLMLYAS